MGIWFDEVHYWPQDALHRMLDRVVPPQASLPDSFHPPEPTGMTWIDLDPVRAAMERPDSKFARFYLNGWEPA